MFFFHYHPRVYYVNSAIQYGTLSLKNHRDLDVWQQSIDFSVAIYKVTATFPHIEQYGLASQMKRAAVSISSNIAEGAARKSTKEFINFLHIALGSASEVETQLLIAEKLGYMSKEHAVFGDLGKIQKMIMGLIRYLRDHAA